MTKKEHVHPKPARPRQKPKANATPSTARRVPRPGQARRAIESVRIAANAYCLRHYGVGYSGGVPQRLLLRRADIWIVPAVLTSPGYGVVGEVGWVAVDAATHEILGATPLAQVRAAGDRLAEEKKDELQAAFHRTRKA